MNKEYWQKQAISYCVLNNMYTHANATRRYEIKTTWKGR